MDSPAIAPNADALTACQIRGLPLGGNQDKTIVKPDHDSVAARCSLLNLLLVKRLHVKLLRMGIAALHFAQQLCDTRSQ